MALLDVVQITKTYQQGSRVIEVLKGINLTIEPGQMTAIIGASGSGKSTLLKILGTLESPTAGDILFQNEHLSQKSNEELALFRNRSLGFIFQFHHLLPEFSALENVMMPGLIAGKSRKEMEGYARELLTQVELDERFDHRVQELSGGEQQRTALARALIMQPALLLADEPTGNLDSRAGNLAFDLLHRLCKERELATLMVTHNMDLAERMDTILTLNEGVLVS